MKLSLEQQQYYAYTASREVDPALDTVIFVHGTAMDHSVWCHQSRFFAYHGYNALAIDLPGHGQSDGDSMDSIEGYARWLNELMGPWLGRRHHLIGHSMGSLICLEAAGDRHAKAPPLASLSLVGFCFPMTVAPVLLDAARDRPEEAYAMMTQWSHASPIGGEPNPGFWSTGNQYRLMENSRHGAVFTDLTACNTYQGAPGALEGTNCPILFLSGIQDRMAPCKLAKRTADEHPSAEIALLPDCGHNLMSESPDGVRDALIRFIRENP
ncbi:MAG: alpha/beta hydrolase [Gammaproteobacteria bacterium]|nr:alpha/beta hydrolase [Gammaproteobacteria bacterium]